MRFFFFFLLVIGIIGTISNIEAEKQVPDWIKNTAGWWAENAISETEFVNAIEFLVKNGIINVNEKNDFIKQRGMEAIGPLMGPVMSKFRGEMDGAKINTLLIKKIKEKI